MYDNIISIENLCNAWSEFVKGKKSKRDVSEFSLNLSRNIYELHTELKTQTYTHNNYQHFKINDPKPRDIHKAMVKDRLLHHAIYRILYPYFDNKFIYDSYSCRLRKGTHKAILKISKLTRKVSKNNTKQCYILKCDIKKFFASIDQYILMEILKNYIEDQNTIKLIEKVTKSFHSTELHKGLPLGNLTSQLLVNIYMNEFDNFIKHILKVKYYIRYADDFIILSKNKDLLMTMLPKFNYFLKTNLKLLLNPNKIHIKTIYSGIDYLGWVHFPHYRVLRTSTKKRIFRNLKLKEGKMETIQSYLGLLRHGDAYKLENKIKKEILC